MAGVVRKDDVDDVRSILHAADVVCVPSDAFDACPLTILEAFACGLPVIATKVGGIPELMAGSWQRFLVEPGDADGLASQLAAVRHWRSREPELSTLARATAVERFEASRMVREVEAVLESVANRTRQLDRPGSSNERMERLDTST